jgi:hypothetical protein
VNDSEESETVISESSQVCNPEAESFELTKGKIMRKKEGGRKVL